MNNTNNIDELKTSLSLEDDDIDLEFASSMKALEASIDEEKLKRDTKDFASQFPQWDLHPPRDN